MLRWIGRFLFVNVFMQCALDVASASPLSFNEAIALAVRSSPDIVTQDASVAAAKSASTASGRLPDPRLAIGVQNVPINGPDQWSLSRDFMTMTQIGFIQEVPNRGVRRAQSDAAQAAVDRVEAERRIRILTVRRDTAVAWLNRYYLERRVAVFDDLDRENHLLTQIVQAQLAGGKGQAADVLVPQQESAELADRRDELAGELAKATAALSRWVGARAEEPLAGEPPTFSLDVESLRGHVHAHPELAVFTPMVEQAQAEVHQAEAMKRPDWGVELMYGRRGAGFSDMVSLQFTVGLPIFSRTRQEPLVAAKREELARIESERESMLRDHTDELETELAEYETIGRQLARLRQTRLPLARQKVDYQFADYRGGKGDLTLVLTARRELIDLRLDEISLQSRQAALTAKLNFLYGEGAK